MKTSRDSIHLHDDAYLLSKNINNMPLSQLAGIEYGCMEGKEAGR